MNYDFSKLSYDISELKPHEKVIDKFKDLADQDEFSDPNNDHLLRIAILLVDPYSPFVKTYNTIEQRVAKIFEYLDIKDHILLGKVTTFTEDRISAMIGKLFMLINHYEYQAWYSLWVLYQQVCKRMQDPLDKDDINKDIENKLKVQKQSEEIKNLLLTKEVSLFKDDKLKRLIVSNTAKTISNYAEKYAEDHTVI